MKRLFVLSIIISILAFVPVANALTITFNTPSGATIGGLPVSASATFVTAMDSITLTLTNLQADPRSVIQCISDILFTLSVLPSSFGFSYSGSLLTVASDGTWSPASASFDQWLLDSSYTGTTKHLTALGGAQPRQTIIGPPDGSNEYGSANNSIAGNGTHNPFLYDPVTFNISAVGVDADTTISDVVFSFGTYPGHNVSAIPEPATMLLLGSGLIGFAGILRKKFKR